MRISLIHLTYGQELFNAVTYVLFYKIVEFFRLELLKLGILVYKVNNLLRLDIHICRRSADVIKCNPVDTLVVYLLYNISAEPFIIPFRLMHSRLESLTMDMDPLDLLPDNITLTVC